MITYSGREVFPANSTEPGVAKDVGPSLEDIAVGLGRQSRFAGQTREFYSVLTHSLVCWQVAMELWPEDRDLRRVLLLHDGHESVLSDTPTTWKGPQTRCDEYDLDTRIWREFGLADLDLDPDLSKRVKMVDYAALAAEAHALGHAEAEKWWPRGEFDDVVFMVEKLTIMQLTAGNPTRYLTPESAIAAMKRVIHR